MRSTAEFTGVRVLAGKKGTRRIGKILRAVFYPDDYRLAGYIVKRPDLLLMFKRQDRFFAWDRFKVVDGRVVVSDEKGSWDKAAWQRLGLDWEQALILQGLPVLDSAGQEIGQVSDVEYDPQNGITEALLLSVGFGTKALIGQLRLPVTDIKQCKNSQLVLRQGAQIPDLEGGLAAKAGEQAAIVGNIVKTQADAASTAVGELAEKAGKGVEKLGYKTGKAIGKAQRQIKKSSKQITNDGEGLVDSSSKALGRQIGKTRGMFKAFQDEYKKASED